MENRVRGKNKDKQLKEKKGGDVFCYEKNSKLNERLDLLLETSAR